jgi:excisionase family DNA binding protein
MESVGDCGPPPVGAADGDASCTVAEAASEAGVSRQTVHDWIRRGHLDAEKAADGALRVRRDDLRRLAELRRVANASHVRLATVRHWADGADEEAGDGPA